MASFSVLAVAPTNQDWISDTPLTVSALIARHDGRYLARTASHVQVKVEDTAAAPRAILTWP